MITKDLSNPGFSPDPQVFDLRGIHLVEPGPGVPIHCPPKATALGLLTHNLDRAMRFRNKRCCDTAELKPLQSTTETTAADED